MEVTHRKFGLLIIKEIWFNDNPNFIPPSSFNFYILKQSVKINYKKYIVKREEFYTTIIDLTKDLDEIWKNFDKKSTRYEIKKALKYIDKIKILKNKDYDLFFKLGEIYYKEKYFKNIKYDVNKIKKLYKNHILYSAYYDGDFICGLFFIYDKDRIRLFKAFSKYFINENYKKISNFLNRYLHWYAIQEAKKMGFKIYDFGGINLNPNSETYGITKFKLSFGGNIIKEYNYIVHKYAKLAHLLLNLKR